MSGAIKTPLPDKNSHSRSSDSRDDDIADTVRTHEKGGSDAALDGFLTYCFILGFWWAHKDSNLGPAD